MREIYYFVKSYFLNGVFAYSLFGLYALTVSPVVTHFFEKEERSVFIFFFGFSMLIAEFFALNFKLKMIRIRAQEKRIAYKKETGIDIIPSTNKMIFFAFCMRLVFRVSVVMVSMTALGYVCTEKEMSPQGEVVLLIWLFADISGFLYMYLKSDFYTDPPQTRKDLQEELKEEDDWDKINLPLASSESYFRKELISDIILQVYALMLFTSFWKYINQSAIEMLNDLMLEHATAVEAAFCIFPMLFGIVVLGLMPMRIAYWIEDSMEAFTKRERLGMWITFFIVAIFVCSPAILKFITTFLFGIPEIIGQSSVYTGYLLSIGLFLLLLTAQFILFGKRKEG